MKIGFPCMGSNLPWQAIKTFRLASYSDARVHEAVQHNLTSLQRILEYNVAEGLLFFRLSSDLIPFASHPVNTYPWREVFAGQFRRLGQFIRAFHLRISAHPDQFTLINSPDEDIFQRSVAELEYHADVMDLLGLDTTAKIQIHVGGVYGAKEQSILRFIERYQTLSPAVRRRLVIENDDRLYSFADCWRIHEVTGIPILFDSFHHSLNHNGSSLEETLPRFVESWEERDGLPMLDYSSQEEGKRTGTHCGAIDLDDFAGFIRASAGYDFDIMLEIKDKETSALRARDLLLERQRI